MRAVGQLFVDYARSADSNRRGFPADTPVHFYIGGQLAKVVPSASLLDRQEWRGCPPSGGYAARSCPLSLLQPFVDYPGPIAITSQPPRHPCVEEGAPPTELAPYRSVTLTPDEGRDCMSYFAVQLFVNDVGQIVAVDLVMSEP